MRWRLILKEFGPELKYIKGENSVVTDALSFDIFKLWAKLFEY